MAGTTRRPLAFHRRRIVRALRRRTAERKVDPELQQLRQLVRASTRSSPDVVIFGDSVMFWTTEVDEDRRNLADMMIGSLAPGTSYTALVGPGYNPRIITAYLEVIKTLPHRPRAIVLPVSILMAMNLFIEHPSFSYRLESEDIRAMAASGQLRESTIRHSPPEAFEAYDRLPAPSLVGARRTAGEHRLLLNSRPSTRWQTAIRVRAITDYYAAERLEDDTPGVVLYRELGVAIRELGIPTVAYVPPGNHEIFPKTLGAAATEHVKHNVNVVVSAYLGGAGPDAIMVDAFYDSPASEFIDPAHVGSTGRLRLAGRLADALRPLL